MFDRPLMSFVERSNKPFGLFRAISAAVQIERESRYAVLSFNPARTCSDADDPWQSAKIGSKRHQADAEGRLPSGQKSLGLVPS